MNFRSSDGSRQTIFHILDEMESAGQDFVTWDEFKTRVLGPEYGQHHDARRLLPVIPGRCPELFELTKRNNTNEMIPQNNTGKAQVPHK